MMTAVLIASWNVTDGEIIGTSGAHALLTNEADRKTTTLVFKENRPMSGVRNATVRTTIEVQSERLVWDIVRSITLAVRAFQLAHGDWRRRSARCGEAGGRAISLS